MTFVLGKPLITKKKETAKKSQLQTSAELYSESTAEMARAVSTMANSISELAAALTLIGKALLSRANSDEL